MADIPNEIQWLTVNMSGIAAVADSTDVGSAPDSYGLNGTVEFRAIGVPNPYLVDGVGDKFVIPRTVTAILYNGVLYPPANGIAPVANEVPTTTPGINLIAPLQSVFDTLSWYWMATVIPAATEGNTWSKFVVSFTGEGSEVISLAQRALAPLVPMGLTQQPKVWIQSGTALPPTSVPGQFLLDTTTMNLYLIGA